MTTHHKTDADKLTIAVGVSLFLSIILVCFFLTGAYATSAADIGPLQSPDGRIQVSIRMPEPGTRENPRWSASFHGKPILTNCVAGLQTADAGDLMTGVQVLYARRRSANERIPVLFGKADHANDHYY